LSFTFHEGRSLSFDSSQKDLDTVFSDIYLACFLLLLLLFFFGHCNRWRKRLEAQTHNAVLVFLLLFFNSFIVSIISNCSDPCRYEGETTSFFWGPILSLGMKTQVCEYSRKHTPAL